MNMIFKPVEDSDFVPQPDFRLTPSQAGAAQALERIAGYSNIVALAGPRGVGKSTILEKVAKNLQAKFVTMDDMLHLARMGPGFCWDGPVMEYLEDLVDGYDVLVIDGLTSIIGAIFSARFTGRETILPRLYERVEAAGKTLILDGAMPNSDSSPFAIFGRHDIPLVALEGFKPEDYRCFIENALGDELAHSIDSTIVHRFAAFLNGHELKVACGIAAMQDNPDTASFIEAIAEFVIRANTRTREVEDIRFETMPGMENIARQLETHVVLPLTNPGLALEHDLMAKRGVLLYGPPGTGKTSVGRALAQRLKGRFFLIDGSVKTEPAYAFISQVQAVARDAIKNSPSIIFIDDADVLFDIGHVAGLTRYLLTLLDGLASDKASKVCVMMTAMDASKIPDAILRSGRVELWLETKAPEAVTRSSILQRWIGDVLPNSDEIDYDALGAVSDGFTPADLRRVAADARSFYAYDKTRGKVVAKSEDYLRRAIEDVVATRQAMAINLSDPSLRIR